jgi:hypothetical protein
VEKKVFYDSKRQKPARWLVWHLDMSGGSAGNAARSPQLHWIAPNLTRFNQI